MACNIQTQNGKTIVLDDNGNPSKLYEQALEKFGEETARDIFLASKSKGFTDLFGEKEPNLETVLNYITEQKAETVELNKDQIVDLQNFAISTPNFNIETLKEVFYTDGLFIVDTDKLVNSGLYSRYEAENLQNDLVLQQEVKKSIERLKNSDITLLEDNFENLQKVNEVNSFGKLDVLNPYAVQKEIVQQLGATTQREFEDGLQSLEYQNINPSFEEMQKYAPVEVYKEVDGQISPKKVTETEITLNQVAQEPSDKLLQSLSTLNNTSLFVLQNSSQETAILLKTVENEAVNSGFDFIGMSDRPIDAETINFLQNFQTFLSNPTAAEFKTFSDNYDQYFKKDVSPQIKKIQKKEKDRNFVKLDTNLSEEEVYKQQSLIKAEPGLYIKVNPKTSEELYPILYTYNNNEFKTLDEFKTDAQSKLDGSFENPEIAEQIALFKMYFGISEVEGAVEGTIEGTNFTGNQQYLTKDFVSDFYIAGLKEKAKDSKLWKNYYSNFGVNEKGLYLVNDDPITLSSIKLYADENLKQYSLLSRQMPNLVETEGDNNFETKTNRRDKAINQPQTVKRFEGQVSNIDDSNLILKNSVDEFVNIKGDIFENIESEGNLSLYSKLEKNDSNYNIFNVKSPDTNLKIADYLYLNIQPEKFTSVKNYISKEQKEKITEEKFDC